MSNKEWQNVAPNEFPLHQQRPRQRSVYIYNAYVHSDWMWQTHKNKRKKYYEEYPKQQKRSLLLISFFFVSSFWCSVTHIWIVFLVFIPWFVCLCILSFFNSFFSVSFWEQVKRSANFSSFYISSSSKRTTLKSALTRIYFFKRIIFTFRFVFWSFFVCMFLFSLSFSLCRLNCRHIHLFGECVCLCIRVCAQSAYMWNVIRCQRKQRRKLPQQETTDDERM